MKMRQVALLGLAGLWVLAGVGAAACSSTTANQNYPRQDSGNGGDNDGSQGSSSGTSGNPTPGDDSGADAGTDAPVECGALPTLHPTDGGTGTFCFVGDAGGKGNHCGRGETCCRPPGAKPNETCAASPTACAVPDGGTTFQCEDGLQCGAGESCYLVGSVREDDGGCGLINGYRVLGSVCHAPPALAGENEELCSQQSDCDPKSDADAGDAGDAGEVDSGATPRVCTPFKTNGRQLGYCK